MNRTPLKRKPRIIKKLQSKRQKKPRETTTEISRSVRPERVSMWPNWMLARWRWMTYHIGESTQKTVTLVHFVLSPKHKSGDVKNTHVQHRIGRVSIGEFLSCHQTDYHLANLIASCDKKHIQNLHINCTRKMLYHHHHHHHVPEGLGMLSCSLILKMKLVPPSLPRSSYVVLCSLFVQAKVQRLKTGPIQLREHTPAEKHAGLDASRWQPHH
jgi:hypothetical protein